MPESAMPTHQDPADALLPSAEPADSAMTILYRAALGPIGTQRYLPRFTHFDHLGRTRPGWNTAASLCTLSWMALRHLWGPALVYVAAAEGLALLVFGVGRAQLQWPDAVHWGLMAVFGVLALVLPGLYGDAILHTEIRKRIARALAATRTIPEACAQLERQAGSFKRLSGLAALNLLLLAAAIAAYWVLPPGDTPDKPVPDAAIPLPTMVAPASHAAPAALPASDPLVADGGDAPASAPSATSSSEEMAPAAVAPTATASIAAAAIKPPSAIPVSNPSAATSQPSSGVANNLKQRTPARSKVKPAAAPAPQASLPASTPLPMVGSTPGYYINVGLFAEEANARKTQARLLNEGLPAFRQPLKTAKGPRIRVRVGPYGSAKEAGVAASRIRGLQLDAVVFKQ